MLQNNVNQRRAKLAIFKASAAVEFRSELFLDFTHCRMIVY